MARWTGEPAISAVLEAAATWRDRCFLGDGSVFTEASLWTITNVEALFTTFSGNPILGNRTFYDKLQEQLTSASADVKKLAAECIWVVLLFPYKTSVSPTTKLRHIEEIWGWSGESLPTTPLLGSNAASLEGIGSPGTFYLTGIPTEFQFLLTVLREWKSLPAAERSRLMTTETPWTFVSWLDQIPDADKRPTRNTLLYLLFPDYMEPMASSTHKRLIYAAFKHKIPAEQRLSGSSPALASLDRAIFAIRQALEAEYGTAELSFYRAPIQGQWLTKLRDDARKAIAADLSMVLNDYNLQLNQCGSKRPTLEKTRPVDDTTGFWQDPSDATNKPLRWFVHLDLTGDSILASIPPGHGAQRLGAFNAAQGSSGAVAIRVIPAIKVAAEKYVFYEAWEWMLLFCFLPALPVGSSAQLLEGYDSTTGEVQYLGHPQPYISAALIGLNADDDVFSTSVDGVSRSATYAQATDAIKGLLHVAPTFAMPAEHANGN